MMYGKSKHGSELPQSRLNETLVRLIREQHSAKEEEKRKLDEKFSVAAFAKRYQVHPHTIEKALSYATWKHVKD